jgi:hypothetical protein
MPDPIDPSAIPGDNLRPDMVEIAAGEIKTIGDEVSDQGGVVVSTWQRLAPHDEAPEAATLFGVMDPVKSNAETFGSNVDRVSSALKTYAAEVEPIKAELARRGQLRRFHRWRGRENHLQSSRRHHDDRRVARRSGLR